MKKIAFTLLLLLTACGPGAAPEKKDDRDAGPGVSPALQGRLFEASPTTKPDGMGMGLSICRTIVEAYGGRIRAAPAPGGGTSFEFTLPQALLESDG